MTSLEVTSGVEEKILEEAIRSPSVAMMRLSLEIDRQLRLILAAIGRLKGYTSQSPTEAFDLIALSITPGSVFPTALRDTVQDFWDLRNQIVHGSSSQQGLSMRAVDYGLRILRMLSLIPRPSYIVVDVTTLFSDAECRFPLQGVNGVILESFGPNGESHGQNIHPSRRNYYAGQSLSWEWASGGERWNETWYVDPKTKETRLAWIGSVEFTGRPLELI